MEHGTLHAILRTHTQYGAYPPIGKIDRDLETMTAINIAMTSVSCQLLFLCVATSMAILVIATKARPEPTDNKPVTVLSTVCTRNFRP